MCAWMPASNKTCVQTSRVSALGQAGVSADAISHEDYLNAPGEEVTTKFTKPGKYSFHCEPHEGAGMNGTVTVQ